MSSNVVLVPENLEGLAVTVVGLGIEGASLVRYLADRGARVTVSDARPEPELAAKLAEIAGLDVMLALGSNDPATVHGASLVFVSQGVPLDLPIVRAAQDRGTPVTSVTAMFAQRWTGPIAAITGSAGKTTTTSLVDAMLSAAALDHLLVGNIGVWPLAELDRPVAGRWAVMEISHTQLQMANIAPRVACITNITPNHLDRFTWNEYVALKRNLINRQSAVDWAVLNYDDAEGWRSREATKARVLAFSARTAPDGPAVYVDGGTAVMRRDNATVPLFDVSDLRLRGLHNLENALAASATAALCGVPPSAIAAAIQAFRGVAHRLEYVATIDGAAYYNDSIATAPERTLAGMRSFDEPLILLLGGRDKHLPLAELTDECYRRCRGVVLFGESAPLFERAFAGGRPGGTTMPVVTTETLEEAILASRKLARRGDVVLLSPACTSFDAYRNFEERGAHFRSLVSAFSPNSLVDKEPV